VAVKQKKSGVGRQSLVRVEFREVSGCRQTSARRSVRDPTCGVLTVKAEPARMSSGPHMSRQVLRRASCRFLLRRGGCDHAQFVRNMQTTCENPFGQARDVDLLHIKKAPYFDPPCSNPGFRDLLRCMNFPPSDRPSATASPVSQMRLRCDSARHLPSCGIDWHTTVTREHGPSGRPSRIAPVKQPSRHLFFVIFVGQRIRRPLSRPVS